MNAIVNPHLPLFASLPAALVFFGLLVALLKATPSTAGRLLLVTIWLRYNLSANPGLSFTRIGGLSVNAINSILIVAAALFLLSRSKFVWMAVPPVAALAGLILLSATMNGNPAMGIETTMKLAYFLVIASAFVESSEDIGYDAMLTRVLGLHLIPLGYQAITLVLGLAKRTEGDDAASYIGGYNHEAAFSIVLVTGMMVTVFNRSLSPRLKFGLVAVFTLGIILANYRTSIIAALPFLIAAVVLGLTRSFVPRQRALALGVAVALVLGAAVIAPQVAGDRFEELSQTIDDGPRLIKPANTFNRIEKQLMSARAYIWAGYFDGWADGTYRQKWVGHGQDSWEGKFPVYAHNTLVSELYELGAAGITFMIGLWAWMLITATRIEEPDRAMVVAAHVSFIVLNMATMPLWQVEGMILYGLLCGVTFALLRRRLPSEDAVPADNRDEDAGAPGYGEPAFQT